MEVDDAPRPCAATSVRRAARVLSRVYDASLASSGMNITQLAVMRTVRRHPDEPLTRVAEDLGMDKTSLYRELTNAQRKKWIKIRKDADGRSRNAVITEKGRNAMSKVDPDWARIQTGLIDRFGREKWKAFSAELKRLTECAEAEKAAQKGI